MNIYRYKTIINGGVMLDMDMDALGRDGWECMGMIPLYRRIPGGLGSEHGINPDQQNTYVYLFKREIGPHSFQGQMPKLSQGECGICGLDLNREIHIGVKRA